MATANRTTTHPPVADPMVELARIREQLDTLTTQVGHLYEHTRAMEDLRDELVPIAKEAMSAMQTELGAVEHELRSDEMVYLLRKLLRSTPRFIRFLERAESLDSLMLELEPLGKDVMRGAVETLADAEARGWFRLARGGAELVDEIARHATDEDIDRLRENVVTIVDTVKQMTQPEVLSIAQGSLQAVREAPAHKRVGLFGLMRAMREPEIQEGVGVLLELLRQAARHKAPDAGTPHPNQNGESHG